MESQISDWFIGQLDDTLDTIALNPALYAKRPGKDFTRNRRITFQRLTKFFITADGASLKKAITSFMHNQGQSPDISYQAFTKQRAKLTESAPYTIFREFNKRTQHKDVNTYNNGYTPVAVDGTGVTIATNSNSESYIEESDSNQFWITTMFDTCNKTFIDLDVRTRYKQYEVDSCIQMIERNHFRPKSIIIGDRLYGTLNLMGHLSDKENLFYVLRWRTENTLREIKELPDAELDVTREITVISTQTNKDKKLLKEDKKYHFVPGKSKFGKEKKDVRWDKGNYFTMRFRIVKFQLVSGEWEVLTTNLPREDFSIDDLKDLYHHRWCIETGFRHLKYDVGMINLHSKRDDFVIQDIYFAFTAFNLYSRIREEIERRRTQNTSLKYEYKTNVSQTFFLVRKAVQHTVNPIQDLDRLIAKHLIPVRPGRSDPRTNLKCKAITSFEYRVA